MDNFEEKILNAGKGNLMDNIHAVRDEAVKTKVCPKCQKSANHTPFTDEVSEREAKISGFCQTCQDEFFD